ncbi:MAG: V-type ATP synthase subunit F [Candidatus Bathyarchaeia archaeon]
MASIAVLADRETATYFKMAGVRNSFHVESREEAEEKFTQLLSNKDVTLIFITEEVNEWLSPILNRIRRSRDYPLVTSIPGKRGKTPSIEQLAQLIKRTVGVEIKIG